MRQRRRCRLRRQHARHARLLQGLLQSVQQRWRQRGVLRLRRLLLLLQQEGLHGGCLAARLRLRQRRQRRVLLQQPVQLLGAALLHERGSQLPASRPLLRLQQCRCQLRGPCCARCLLLQLSLQEGGCGGHGWPCLRRHGGGHWREAKH